MASQKLAEICVATSGHVELSDTVSVGALWDAKDILGYARMQPLPLLHPHGGCARCLHQSAEAQHALRGALPSRMPVLEKDTRNPTTSSDVSVSLAASPLCSQRKGVFRI